MATRLGRYLLNSIKVAILGFCWFILFQVPWESLPNAPLGGKLIAAVMVWAAWSFMVMIVSGEPGKEGGLEMTNQESVDACAKLPELPKTVDTRFDICQDIALVLKVGRDFQNKDGYRGAHYDTVKLLCDAIEYQQEQLKAKTEAGDAAKLREALEFAEDELWAHGLFDASKRIASALAATDKEGDVV